MPAFHPKPQNNQHVFLVLNGLDTSVNSSNYPRSPRFTSVTCRFFCVYKFHAPKKLCKEDHPSPRWNKRHFTVRELGPEASGADSKAESINFFPWEASNGSDFFHSEKQQKRHKNWCLRRKGSLPEKFQGYLENLKMQGFFGYFGWVGFPLHTPCSLQKVKKKGEDSSILDTWNVWWLIT